MARLLQALRIAREEGHNTAALMNALDISRDGLRKIENGVTRRPSERTIDGVRRLGINPGWVRTGRGEQRTEPGESYRAGSRGVGSDTTTEAVNLERDLLWLVSLVIHATPAQRADIVHMVAAYLRPATPDGIASTRSGGAPRTSTGVGSPRRR